MDAGPKAEDEKPQRPAQTFREKRTRMFSQPTAVQMNAKLLAIRQVATCC